MAWWEYRVARRTGHSIFTSLSASVFNKKLPSKAAKTKAELEATLKQIEKRDPELAARLRRDNKTLFPD